MKSGIHSAFVIYLMLPVAAVVGCILVILNSPEQRLVSLILGFLVGFAWCLLFWKREGMTLIISPRDAGTSVKLQKKILIAISGAGALLGFYMLFADWPSDAMFRWNPIFAAGLIYLPNALIGAIAVTMWKIIRFGAA